MSITTMKQALEALSDFDYDKRMVAITALRQAIEAEKREWVELTEEEKIELKNSNMPTMALIDTICSILRMQNT